MSNAAFLPDQIMEKAQSHPNLWKLMLEDEDCIVLRDAVGDKVFEHGLSGSVHFGDSVLDIAIADRCKTLSLKQSSALLTCAEHALRCARILIACPDAVTGIDARTESAMLCRVFAPWVHQTAGGHYQARRKDIAQEHGIVSDALMSPPEDSYARQSFYTPTTDPAGDYAAAAHALFNTLVQAGCHALDQANLQVVRSIYGSTPSQTPHTLFDLTDHHANRASICFNGKTMGSGQRIPGANHFYPILKRLAGPATA